MESSTDRLYRPLLPPQRWRFTRWILTAYLITYIHARVRPQILRRLPGEFLPAIYVRVTTTALMVATLTAIGFLVAAYYFVLRERRLHTDMTERGLAVRTTIAGILGLGGFVLFLLINDGRLP